MDKKKQPQILSEEQLSPILRQLLPTFRKLVPKQNEDDPEPMYQGDQEAIIERIMDGGDVLAIMPTGGGKSICYQVPAMHLPGITLVISPLLALMEDQVRKLHNRGFPVACLSSAFIADRDGFLYYKDKDTNGKDGENGGFKPESIRERRNQIFLGAARGAYKLLYVTPERLQSFSFIRFVKKTKISMIAVDEAHCISMWGYDFRPRYLEISRLLAIIGYHPIIAAFTATATKSVQEDIKKLLRMRKPKVIPRNGKVSRRENLNFSVESTFTEKVGKKKKLLSYLQENHGKCGFVYCSKIKFVNSVWKYLKCCGIAATRYYANLDADLETDAHKEEGESKQKNLEDFLNGKKTVMVSTTALGMGIDKRDIRFVIHYNLPTCLENYYQEAGRAGRDGKAAACVLYYSEHDVKVCEGMNEKTIKNRGLSAEEEEIRREITKRRLDRMKKYAEQGAEKSSDTLQQTILDYFYHFGCSDEDKKQRASALARMNNIDVLYVNRTKVANELRKGRMAGENLVVGRPHDGLPKPTVSYRVTGEAPLNYFDLMAADAVYTLMTYRIPTIYAKTVMELLSGNENLLLQPERKDTVEESIRKMICTYIEINRSSSKDYGFDYGENKLVIRGAFLPLYEKETGGFGYDDGAIPPLYEYAEILNEQFFFLPTKHLCAGREDKNKKLPKLPATSWNLAMTHYLLCRIGMMSHAPGNLGRTHAVSSSTLRFDTMINDLGIDRPSKKWYRDRKIKMLWDEKMLPILKHLQAGGIIAEYDADPETQTVVFHPPDTQE